jgi:starvation-inducible DNA-binding protein
MAKVKVSEMPAKIPGPGTRRIDRMFKNRVALDESTKQQVVEMLNFRLAEASDAYSQTKFAHWNVKGLNFYQLHLLFDTIAESIEGQIDGIAERLTALGGVANGTVRQAANHSTLPEYNVDAVTGPDHLRAMIDLIATYAANLREGARIAGEAGDEPTHDFFNQMIVDTEQHLYFLESHLESGETQ